MWKTLLRPAMIFIPLALGLFFPEAGKLNFLIRYLLMTMLFMVFLKLNLKDLIELICVCRIIKFI